ncbi:uncharacterized protein LOC144986616 [Oryzias latipes]
MAEPRVFSKSLSCVPKFTSTDVMKSVKMHSSTKGNKLDKGYKFVHEEFIHHYQERTLFTAGSAGCCTPPPPRPARVACKDGTDQEHRTTARSISDGIWKQIMPGAAPTSHGCVGWVSEME